jgi:hypothetical protein
MIFQKSKKKNIPGSTISTYTWYDKYIAVQFLCYIMHEKLLFILFIQRCSDKNFDEF